MMKDSTNSNGNDLTMERHDEEKRNILIEGKRVIKILERLRYTRGRGNAVRNGQERPISRGDECGGKCDEELGSGRWAQRGGEQHTSIALDGRRSGDTPNWMLVISELQFGWRRRCYNNGWTEDLRDTS